MRTMNGCKMEISVSQCVGQCVDPGDCGNWSPAPSWLLPVENSQTWRINIRLKIPQHSTEDNAPVKNEVDNIICPLSKDFCKRK